MEFHGTTICAVKRDGVTAIAGDGQVTMGESVIFKNTAVKVRRIYGGKVILGFAGSVLAFRVFAVLAVVSLAGMLLNFVIVVIVIN